MKNSTVPRVSVIIPLYNKALYIKRAIDSVFAQTVQDFEIVVVGGNSTDGGEDIVLGYSDSRIRFVKETGKGVSAARNQGVDVARAELVAFLDADDEWLPEFLETILRLREMWPDAGMYGTGFKVISATGNDRDFCYRETEGDRVLDSYFAAKMEFCNHRGGQLIATSGTVVMKDIFQKVGGFPEWAKQSEDRALRGKIALISDVAYSPNVCTLYYSDTENNSSHFSDFLRDPFSEWVHGLTPELYSKIKDRYDYEHIVDFNESALLYMIWRNLRDCPEDRWQIFAQIKDIHLPHNKGIKYKYIAYWILPSQIRKYYFKFVGCIWSKLLFVYRKNRDNKLVELIAKPIKKIL